MNVTFNLHLIDNKIIYSGISHKMKKSRSALRNRIHIFFLVNVKIYKQLNTDEFYNCILILCMDIGRGEMERLDTYMIITLRSLCYRMGNHENGLTELIKFKKNKNKNYIHQHNY